MSQATYVYNPTANPALNLDNCLGTPLNVMKNGVLVPYWQINGPVPSGAVFAFMVQVQFMEFFSSGLILPPGQAIEGVPVTVALNYKNIWESDPGVTITGNFSSVSNENGQAPVMFALSGPVGAKAVVSLKVGSETYVFFMTLEAPVTA